MREPLLECIFSLGAARPSGWPKKAPRRARQWLGALSSARLLLCLCLCLCFCLHVRPYFCLRLCFGWSRGERDKPRPAPDKHRRAARPSIRRKQRRRRRRGFVTAPLMSCGRQTFHLARRTARTSGRGAGNTWARRLFEQNPRQPRRESGAHLRR